MKITVSNLVCVYLWMVLKASTKIKAINLIFCGNFQPKFSYFDMLATILDLNLVSVENRSINLSDNCTEKFHLISCSFEEPIKV